MVAAYINHNSWLGHTENGHGVCNLEYRVRLPDKTSSGIRQVQVAKGMNLYFASSGLARGEGEWCGRPGWQNGQKVYFKLSKKKIRTKQILNFTSK